MKKKQNELKLHKYIIQGVEVLVLVLLFIFLLGFWELLNLHFKG